MALSHIERGQSPEEAVLAAVFNELAVSPEDVPDDIFIPLAWAVCLLCAELDLRCCDDEGGPTLRPTPGGVR